MSARVPRPRPQLGQRGRSTLTPTPPHPDNHTCPRPIDIVVKYDHYCDKSTIDPFTGETHPCPWVTQSKTSEGFDCNDPWYVVAPTQKTKKRKRKEDNEDKQTYSAFVTAQPATASPPPSAPQASAGWPSSAAAGRAACAAGRAMPTIGVSHESNQRPTPQRVPFSSAVFPSSLPPTAVSGYHLYPNTICTTRKEWTRLHPCQPFRDEMAGWEFRMISPEVLRDGSSILTVSVGFQ